MPRALILEDEPLARDTIRRIAEEEGFSCFCAASLGEARSALGAGRLDLALLDLELRDGRGLELLPKLAARPGTEVVFITGHGSVDAAVRALQGGASEYLEKPLELARLRAILRRVRGAARRRSGAERAPGPQEGPGLGPILGRSPAMQRVFALIERVAATPITVLVSGPTGTGKELVAETLHALSGRRDRPFVAVHCGAVSASLIESELFGHERGAFTGADRQHQGVFEQADGGTLFLDEVTEMTTALQARLLRAIESRSIRRVGGEDSFPVDVRLIAATHLDPLDAVRSGQLRRDLYYRLAGFRIELPQLRERNGDVRLIAETVIEGLKRESGQAKVLGQAAIARLERHTWPGNVRELVHVLERAFILADDRIEARHVQLGGLSVRSDAGANEAVGSTIRDMEKRLILATLDRVGGDKPEAARLLGISLKTLYNRLNTYASEDG